MRNIFLNLILSVTAALAISSLAASFGFFGSCFEGSCGYISVFISTPILSAVFFIFFKKWIPKWSKSSQALAWLGLSILLSGLLHWIIGVAAFIWAGFVIRKELKMVRAQSLPWTHLFKNQG